MSLITKQDRKIRIEYKENFIVNGRRKPKGLIMTFQESYAKPLIINTTNSRIIHEKTGVIDATKCMINAPKDKLVVVQGLDDFIVVDTKDVLLICSKEKEQSIKEYVAEVKRNKGDKYI